jgi:nucleotide-binding universal stress UspA family protein
MDYRDILVCLDPSDAGERRLRLAAALARRCGAHLSAAYILPEQIAGAAPYGNLGAPTGAAWFPATGIAGEGPAPGADPALRPDVAGAAELIDLIEERFRAEVPEASEDGWSLLGSGESGDLLELARGVDLVVFGQDSPDYRLPTGYSAREIVLGAGRPMVVVPYAFEFAEIGRRVVVAWDGSREASRAVHDALPLLRHAEAVSVITLRDDEDELLASRPSLERIVRHLTHHGVAARPHELLRGGSRIADLLLNEASDFEADMMVAGAYHHSQLRESLFGGASVELLDHMTLPVLMSR